MKLITYKKIVGLIFIFVLFLVLLNFKITKNQKITEKNNLNTEVEEFTNSNIIEDIKYSSIDLKGNEYLIFAKEGEIDLKDTDIIFLKDVTANIKMNKKNEIIKITSDYGKYNTVSYDTIFSKNVKINYLDNKITSEYLDFSMIKNLLIVTKNVIYTNPENILRADVVEVDTITKDTKIFMHNTKNKVNIESIN